LTSSAAAFPTREARRFSFDKIDLSFAGQRCDQQQAAKQGRKSGETIFMASIQPDNSDPIPLRASPHRMGTLMLRFVGLLFLTVAVLALLYSR
jgi:hypothetical protein